MGVDTFKTDYGEYVPEDAVFENGQSGAAMHNLYPHLYNRAVYGAVASANGADDALVWARSAWTGGQRYPVHWGGDAQVSFSGMANALRGGLSASLSGFGFWSHDIGGFSGRPSEELYVRWAQFGLLSSHARCHGTTPREPWAFGERATAIFRRYAELRYRLLPYIYSHAEQTARTGIPVVRPLVLGYQDDRQARSVESEFLLGEDILVAPVFEPATSREVYLPEGEWVDYWTDERYAGEQWVAVDAPLERLPLFVRAPSLLPTREPTQSVRDGTPERLSFEATLPADGAATASFPFYDEDADSVVKFELARSADGDLSVTVPDSNVESLAVTAAADPSRVTVDGEPLGRVESDPKPGEWTRDETGSVRVRWRDAGG
jgi:alpha-D-xyloside xylohydrolase